MIKKTYFLDNNFIILNDKLYVNNILIKNNDIIQYNCQLCNKLHSQQYTKNFLLKIKSQLICTRCRIEQTNLQKYGSKCSFQSKELKEKIKQTMLNKYGVENPWSFGTDNYKKVIKEKYGVENIMQSKEIQDKTKQTNLQKYGVENIMQSKEIQNKTKQTNLKKYKNTSFLGSNQGIQQSKFFKLTKSYNKFLLLENIQPLFTLEEYLQKQQKYDKFKWQCKICNTEFINYYANGEDPICPKCHPKLNGYSLSEKEIVNYCEIFTSNILKNDREIIKPYEIDIYLPDYKLAIEYNGLYWHSVKFIDDKYYHQNKVKLANEKGIRLLHIWEHEWLEEKELIKETINYYINNLNEEIKPEEPKLYNIYDNLIWI